MSQPSTTIVFAPELSDVTTPTAIPARHSPAASAPKSPWKRKRSLPTISMEDKAAAMFAIDTAEHQMTILKNDGLYRHLRFRGPRNEIGWFDLVTWPGRLTITGDCGTFVFARCDDMFEFFRGRKVNPGYWAEKEKTGAQTQGYSMDMFQKTVTDYFVDCVRDREAPRGLGKAIRDQIFESWEFNLEYEDGARDALKAFEFNGFRFRDTWEWDFSDWDHHFLWCLNAIAYGITQYDSQEG